MKEIVRTLIKKYNSLSVTLKASIWFLVCTFMQKGISVITTPIFTRLLTTEEYGQYSVFESWYGIIVIFVTLNISSGVYMQGLVKFDEDRAQFTSSLQGLTLTLFFFWSIIYFCFKDFWNNCFSLNTIQMTALLMMCWLSAIWGFWAAEQRNDYKYKQLVLVTLMMAFAKPCIGILFVWLADDKVTARIIGLVLVELVLYLSLFFKHMKTGKKFYVKKYWKYAIGLCVPLVPHYLSQIILRSSDRIMIKELVGSSEAGIYSLAYSIAMLMTLFINALSHTTTPWMYQKIKQNDFASMGKIMYTCLIFVAGLNLILIILAPEIVAMFAPKEYYDAIWIIPPVAMSSLVMYTYDFFARFEFYFEKTKAMALASVVGAILNVVLNAIFINQFGYLAAGYTTLLCYILYAVFHYLAMRKICKDYLDNVKVYDVRVLLGIVGGFLLLGFLLLITYFNHIIRYFMVLGIIIFLIAFRKIIILGLKQILILKRKKE